MNNSVMMPLFIFLSIVMVMTFSLVSIVTWLDARRREREAFYRSEMVKKIAEAQGGDAALAFLREEQRIATQRVRDGQRLGGFITLAVGIGMMIFMAGIVHGGGPVWLVGAIPALVGVALLVHARSSGRAD